MVVRHDARGVLAVAQPAHAWLCGQFARAWGNERFGEVTPLDDVVLGAEQHDVGWTRWDLSPQLDPAIGLPFNFTDCGVLTSTALWRTGPPRVLAQSRYAALLATMHGRRLYARLELEGRPAVEAEAITALLRESAQREQELTAALAGDPVLAPHATPEAILRNSSLVWAWDTLSLALLLDWAPHTLRAVPAAGGSVVDVEVRAVAAAGELPTLSLAPWPFTARQPLIVRTEGRRLDATYANEAELHAALEAAPWETVRFALTPAVVDR